MMILPSGVVLSDRGIFRFRLDLISNGKNFPEDLWYNGTMQKKTELRIGETATLFNISPDTLRYYDKIGLLKPRINPESRYRFYREEDLSRLTAILFFRDMDIPIETIRHHLEKHDTENSLKLLEKTEIDIQKKIDDLVEIQNSIRKRIDLIKCYTSQGWEVHTKHFPDRHYKKTDFSIDLSRETYIEFLRKIQHSQELLESERPWYLFSDLCVLIDVDNLSLNKLSWLCPEKDPKAVKLAEGTYACLVYAGDSEETDRQAYEKLLQHVGDRGWKTEGPIIRFWYIGDETTSKEEQFIAEIQIRIG